MTTESIFELTDEQRMFAESLERFLADFSSRSGANDSPDQWQALAEFGVVAAFFNEDQGGFGGSGRDIMVVFEVMGRMGFGTALIDLALLPGCLLIEAGQDVGSIVAGDQRLVFAHGETDSRYELDSVETEAKNGRLTGHKSVVVSAPHADGFLVSARGGSADDPAGSGTGTEIGLWWVERDAPGLMVQDYILADGGVGSEIRFNDTPGELILADAESAISKANASATLAMMAHTLGAMEAAVNLTEGYLSTREQFGRPIGHFQALAHRLVDMVMELEQARSAVILAAQHLEHDASIRDRHISAGKYLTGCAGRLIAEESIQMHGGIGMTEEYALGGFAKHIVMADHRFGDTDYHLERFIELGENR